MPLLPCAACAQEHLTPRGITPMRTEVEQSKHTTVPCGHVRESFTCELFVSPNSSTFFKAETSTLSLHVSSAINGKMPNNWQGFLLTCSFGYLLEEYYHA